MLCDQNDQVGGGITMSIDSDKRIWKKGKDMWGGGGGGGGEMQMKPFFQNTFLGLQLKS